MLSTIQSFQSIARLRVAGGAFNGDDSELNTVLGGGIMPGSICLVGGDPGVFIYNLFRWFCL